MPAASDQKLYEIRNSSIHNRGLFAACDIRKGQKIVEYLGEKVSKEESDRRGTEFFEANKHTGGGTVYLFILDDHWDIDGNVEWNDARLINHSCETNCEANIVRGRIWIVATQKIRKGDELLFNYGFDLESVWDHPCRCGKPKCVGYICGTEYWPKLRRMIRERDRAIEEANTEYARGAAAKKGAAKKSGAAKNGRTGKAAPASAKKSGASKKTRTSPVTGKPAAKKAGKQPRAR